MELSNCAGRFTMIVLAAGIASLTACTTSSQPNPANQSQPIAGPVITVGGVQFRDANRSGTLESYEDWRLPAEVRVNDLVGRMTLEEKAGTLIHATAPSVGPYGPVGAGQSYDFERIALLIREQHVSSFLTRLAGSIADLAAQHNRLQTLAAQTRLGIPLSISTDARNHFEWTLGVSNEARDFSRWPEAIGMAALGDADTMQLFADAARTEYRAAGITMGLSPQPDLATEPRWPRFNATFGEDAQLARKMTRAYVEGFQGGSSLERDGVASIVKHWAGYGAAVDGLDAHNYYGRFNRLDGAFEDHLIPFEGAFEVNAAGVMPSYSIMLDVEIGGAPAEQVGGNFSRQLLTDLLRRRFGFKGLILSDWDVHRDCNQACLTGDPPQTLHDIAMPWGVESLSSAQRIIKMVQAGVDQAGGPESGEPLVKAVRSGQLSEPRLNESVRRVLVIKFTQGLFDNPFVDVAKAIEAGRDPAVRESAHRAQAESLVVLKNSEGVLPLNPGARVHLVGVSPEAAVAAGLVPSPLSDSDISIVRTESPRETLHPHSFFGSRQQEGRLDLRDGDEGFDAIVAAEKEGPVIAVIRMHRPAVLTRLEGHAAAMIAEFGASDGALLAALTGQVPPRGRLPFELPASMADVDRQSPGRPHDTGQPLYPIGHGLSIEPR